MLLQRPNQGVLRLLSQTTVEFRQEAGCRYLLAPAMPIGYADAECSRVFCALTGPGRLSPVTVPVADAARCRTAAPRRPTQSPLVHANRYPSISWLQNQH